MTHAAATAIVLSHLTRYMPAGAASRDAVIDSALKEDLGIKSMQLAAALTAICEEAGVDLFLLSDLDLVRMKTVRDVIAVIAEKATR